MEDSDGPVVARAVYKALTRIFKSHPPILETFLETRSELKDQEMINAALDAVFQDIEKAISEGSHRMLAPLSLADVVDELVRELRVNRGVPSEQWATFVHIGV